MKDWIIQDGNIDMTKRDIIKILFLALIGGNIMGIVLIQIFGELTLLKTNTIRDISNHINRVAIYRQ